MPTNKKQKINNIQTINKLIPVSGWRWINQGFIYFNQSKYIWSMTLFLVILVVLLSRFTLPFLQITMVFISPFIAAGLSLACADIEQGKNMSITYLFKAFTSDNKANIFRYGLLLFLMIIIAQIISSIVITMYGITQEQIANEISILQNNKDSSFQTIIDSQVLSVFFLTTILFTLPVIMINLFAPTIVVFSNLSATQAIKLSMVAGFKNISALIVYFLIYVMFLMVFVYLLNMLAIFIFSVFGEDSIIASALYLVLFFSFIMAFLSISYSSAYVAYKEIFLGGNN